MPQPPFRILIAALGSHGDVHPFVGLAAALRRRGHDVTLIAPAIFEQLTKSVDLDFAPIGTIEQFQQWTQDAALWRPIRGFHLIAERCGQLAEPYYREIAQRVERGRTVLVLSTLVFGGRIAQEKLRIPAVSVHLSPAIFRSVQSPPRTPPLPVAPGMPAWWNRSVYAIADALLIDRAMGRALNAFRTTLDLPAVSGILRNWIHSPDRVIGLFPDWFAPPQPDWPKQTVTTGFPLYDESDVTPIDASLEKFLSEGDAPIAFTPGSAMRHGKKFFTAAVHACQSLGRRGVLLSRFPDHIPANLPAGIRHVEYAPFSRMLPCCAAIVHHGGIGTTAQALASGVPQVAMPMAHDQFDNAARMKRLGVGEVLPMRKCSGASLAGALRNAMDDSHRADCAAVKQRFESDDSLPRTVEWIEQTASR